MTARGRGFAHGAIGAGAGNHCRVNRPWASIRKLEIITARREALPRILLELN
jgi:hypothetical protein